MEWEWKAEGREITDSRYYTDSVKYFFGIVGS